jgi:hypothetical protein
MKEPIFKAESDPSQSVDQQAALDEESDIGGSDEAPGVKSSPAQPIRKKRLGALETPGFELGPDFWEPLDDDEIGDRVRMPEV